MLIDSHVNLHAPQFDDDREAVIERARAAGVGLMVNICDKVANFDKVRAVADAPDIWATVGTHPHEAKDDPDLTAARLIELAADPRVVGIGECGLDFHYDLSPRDIQARVFRAHVAAARETGLPLVIHTRDADEDTAAILREDTKKGAFPAVLHCFTGGRALAFEATDLGLYVSFTGILTYKKTEDLRAIAAALPADRILVETDSPYLGPGKFRGKRCEPAYVVETAKVLAETRGVSLDEIARQTTENFFRLFAKVPKPVAAAA